MRARADQPTCLEVLSWNRNPASPPGPLARLAALSGRRGSGGIRETTEIWIASHDAMTEANGFDAMATDRPGELVRQLRSRLAARGLDPADAQQLRLDLGRALFSQSRWTDASAVLEELVATPALPGSIRVQALGVLAGALVLCGRSTEGTLAAGQVMANPDADPESRVLAHSAVRAVLFFEGRYEDAVAEARQIVAAAAGGGPVARAEARIDMGGMLLNADQFDAARRWLTLEPDAPDHQRGEALELVAQADLLAGRYSDLLHNLRPEAADPTRGDRPDNAQGSRRGLRANALLHLDRLEEASRALEDIPIHVRSPLIAYATAALLVEAVDGPAAAAGQVERIVARSQADAESRPRLRTWGPELVRLAVAAGDRSSAAWIVQALEDAVLRSHLPSVRGAALHARGLLERDPSTLQVAVEAFRQSPRVPAFAQAAEALGTLKLEGG